MPGCPATDTLLALANGRVESSVALELERHVESCRSCLERLSRVANETVLPEEAEPPAAPRLERGTRPGRYVVLGPLGHGAMADVYAAYDPELDRKVALKLLRIGPASAARLLELRLRLRREAQTMARLSHPNVVPLYDVGTFQGRLFLAMELVDGQTFTAWLRASPRGWREIVQMLLQAGEGLAAAHRAGIVHRDFKPDNVLVGPEGRPRVTDFGIARLPAAAASPDLPLSESSPGSDMLTREGGVLGTPAYMAPEQRRGETADARADQYSFCVTLHEALFGWRPAAKMLDKVANAGARRELDVPRWLRGLVARGLSAEPAQRFPSMESLLARLRREPLRRALRRGVFAAVFLAVAGSLLFAWRAWEARSSRCAELAESAWSAEQRRSVIARFASFGAAVLGESVARTLDGWAAAWRGERQRACEEGGASTRLGRAREGCLERRARGLEELVAVLLDPEVKRLDGALEAAQGLPDPLACGVSDARSSPPPDADPAALRRAQSLLARGWVLVRLGELRRAAAVAREAAAATLALGFAALRAEGLSLVGALAQRRGETAPALSALREAYFAASGAGDERARAAIAVDLAGALARGGADGEASERWLRIAGALLARVGEPAALEAELAGHAAEALRRERKLDGALGEATRAATLAEKAHGAADTRTARHKRALAELLTAAGKTDDAQRVLAEAAAAERAVRGREETKP